MARNAYDSWYRVVKRKGGFAAQRFLFVDFGVGAWQDMRDIPELNHKFPTQREASAALNTWYEGLMR